MSVHNFQTTWSQHKNNCDKKIAEKLKSVTLMPDNAL